VLFYLRYALLYINKLGVAHIKQEINRLKIFMFAYWAMILTVTGMYTMYIINIGFSDAEISLAVTISTLFCILGQNFTAYLAERFKYLKKALLLSIGVGLVVPVILMTARQNWQVFAALALWAFFVFGSAPLSDAWCIGFLKSRDMLNNYGGIRCLGSIGYGLAGVLFGMLLQKLGWSIYYWCVLVSVIFTMISILMLTEIKDASFYGKGRGIDKTGSVSFAKIFRETMRIKPVRSIIIVVFLYNFVIKGIYSYLGVLVSDFGGGPLSLGLTHFFDAMPEVVTFLLTVRLIRKNNSKRLIFAAFTLQIIRLSLILIFNSSVAIILAGILSGLAYGLIVTAHKTYIYEMAPDKYKISCLGLSESIFSLSGIISVPVFGFILMRFGGSATILLGLIVNLIGVGIIIGDIYRERIKTDTADNSL